MDAIWNRADRPHFHLRLIAWAMRRCERRDRAVSQVFKRFAA